MITFSRKRYVLTVILVMVATSLLTYISIDLKDLQLDRENIFFWGLIALLTQCILFSSLYFSHRNMVSTLKKITDLNNLSHPYSQKLLKSMGVLGKEIEHMVNEQSIASTLRSNRISALNSMVRILCAGYEEPVLITDVKGAILSISDALSVKINKNDSDASLSMKNLSDFRSDIPLREVLNHLEKQKIPWSNPEIKGVICTPVFDKENVLNFCIWEFESEMFSKLLKEKSKGSFQGLFKKRKRKNQDV